MGIIINNKSCPTDLILHDLLYSSLIISVASRDMRIGTNMTYRPQLIKHDEEGMIAAESLHFARHTMAVYNSVMCY